MPKEFEELDTNELQALARYHASTLVKVIDDGGIKPSKIDIAIATSKRIFAFLHAIKGRPLES